MRAADIDASFRPRRTASAHTEEIDGECVILDERANRLHHLNATATVAWICFDGSGTVAEIAADLAAEFGTEPHTTEADLVALARELAAEGLLAGVEPDPGPESVADEVE